MTERFSGAFTENITPMPSHEVVLFDMSEESPSLVVTQLHEIGSDEQQFIVSDGSLVKISSEYQKMLEDAKLPVDSLEAILNLHFNKKPMALK